jgi:hypothetical protein
VGIRDGASATFVGGAGCVRTAVVRLDLSSLPPFVGLAAETVAGDLQIEPPPGGVVLKPIVRGDCVVVSFHEQEGHNDEDA